MFGKVIAAVLIIVSVIPGAFCASKCNFTVCYLFHDHHLINHHVSHLNLRVYIFHQASVRCTLKSDNSPCEDLTVGQPGVCGNTSVAYTFEYCNNDLTNTINFTTAKCSVQMDLQVLTPSFNFSQPLLKRRLADEEPSITSATHAGDSMVISKELDL